MRKYFAFILRLMVTNKMTFGLKINAKQSIKVNSWILGNYFILQFGINQIIIMQRIDKLRFW